MQKILILGLGAFGFAIAKHLGENNPETTIYASEINSEIFESIQNTRKHPYFFEDAKLPKNIELVGNKNIRLENKDEHIHPLHDILKNTDIIISVIPCQFVGGAFEKMKNSLKDGVTILNLSKGIDNASLQSVSEKLNSLLNPLPLQGKGATNYTYAYLAGGMIASELVEGKMLGADIVTENPEMGKVLQTLFQSETLDIHLKIGNPKNTELYAALKNIVALILGYYEGKGAGASTLGYYFSKLLGELQNIIHELGGDSEINFTDFALSADLIATCFGGSRNRLLGSMLGEGKDIGEALSELKSQNKIAEGYETLKGIYKITEGKQGFVEINNFGEKYISE